MLPLGTVPRGSCNFDDEISCTLEAEILFTGHVLSLKISCQRYLPTVAWESVLTESEFFGTINHSGQPVNEKWRFAVIKFSHVDRCLPMSSFTTFYEHLFLSLPKPLKHF